MGEYVDMLIRDNIINYLSVPITNMSRFVFLLIFLFKESVINYVLQLCVFSDWRHFWFVLFLALAFYLFNFRPPPSFRLVSLSFWIRCALNSQCFEIYQFESDWSISKCLGFILFHSYIVHVLYIRALVNNEWFLHEINQ